MGFYRIALAVVMSCGVPRSGAGSFAVLDYWGYINHMKIGWTEAKRAKTLQERGLDFARAAEVFGGIHVTRQTHGGRTGESRFITAGFLEDRLVVMVWTLRGETRHVMSMRYAHAKEQKLWKEEMEGPR